METVHRLEDVFTIKVSADKLTAEVWYNEANNEVAEEWQWTTEDIRIFLHANRITFGLKVENIEKLAASGIQNQFPLLIAEGYPSVNGKDGSITYSYDTNTEVDRSAGYDFRDVMRIPTVKKGERIATLILPTSGRDGRSVYDTAVKAKPGKPFKMRAGKNVSLNKTTLSFYADEEGQVSVANHALHVHNIYEVAEDISLKTGNIDFLGTVVIRGNVPTGFSIKATGDIKIFGLVEGATITAGGSVYIAEGMAGIKQGLIEAAENVHVGYINQGHVNAGNSIYADNSILHSNCTAVQSIVCKAGNIIGGALSAGQSILIAKDVGNRMNTVTNLTFGVDKKLYDQQMSLEKKKETEEDNLRKLTILRNKLDNDAKQMDPKKRIMVLKVRRSFEQTSEKIKEIEQALETIDSDLGTIADAFLSVKGTLYPNTIVSFGKYRRKMKKKYDNITVRMRNNEISIL